MEDQIIKYVYEDQEIEFDLSGHTLMVNATEMAQVFGKKTNDFLRLDQTKAFIIECLSYGKSRNSDISESENSRLLGIETEEDIVRVNHRHGTWMHRILALKFAAWLSPRFELWVYSTIDQILQNRGPIKPESIAQRRKILTERNGWLAQKLKAQERIQTSNEADTKIIKQAEREIKKLDKQLSALNKTDTNQATLFAQELEE
ncbi:KilA-N domain-containing protein [Spirosoma panaciterrae]|uniref:KilA-N domain-containing protein n=1 Tax=Spirosoma panaciterrae TaxID=496058 RepID=UPI00036B0F6C|nr:KilA-N domain-containing protein [Spirosoma panaciterrae]